MRVAIVIPCYNDQRFLPEALATIDGEEPTEVVVVDDGSDDPATLRLLDSLEQAGIRVLHQHNAGPAAARMAGVAVSQAPTSFRWMPTTCSAPDRCAPWRTRSTPIRRRAWPGGTSNCSGPAARGSLIAAPTRSIPG